MEPDATAIEVKGETTGEPYQEPAFDPYLLNYDETECERSTVKACGTFCCVFLGLCALSWFVHAIPVQTITDTPPFANSLLYLSIAHHTDQWQDAQSSVSPPPPAFGDGQGNFPSA
jgi:hypothetical protein